MMRNRYTQIDIIARRAVEGHQASISTITAWIAEVAEHRRILLGIMAKQARHELMSEGRH